MDSLIQNVRTFRQRSDAWEGSILGYLRHCFELARPDEERFHVVFLDHDRRYRDDCILTCGSGVHLPVRLRDVFARALQQDARNLVVAHNHPSGDCRPSDADLSATTRLREIGQALDIELLDHLIFTREKVYSMRAGGKL